MVSCGQNGEGDYIFSHERTPMTFVILQPVKAILLGMYKIGCELIGNVFPLGLFKT